MRQRPGRRLRTEARPRWIGQRREGLTPKRPLQKCTGASTIRVACSEIAKILWRSPSQRRELPSLLNYAYPDARTRAASDAALPSTPSGCLFFHARSGRRRPVPRWVRGSSTRGRARLNAATTEDRFVTACIVIRDPRPQHPTERYSMVAGTLMATSATRGAAHPGRISALSVASPRDQRPAFSTFR